MWRHTKKAVSEDEKNLFIPPKRESAVEIVINWVKDLLLKGNLSPGDRLPTEMETSKKLNISRGSIREAIKILSAFGIVEIKRGNGTYVSHPFKKQMVDPLLLNLILTSPKSEELIELRELIELGIVPLIIRNAETEDLKRVEKIHIRMEKMVKEKIDDIHVLAVCDLKFHKALGCATKNILIEKIYEFILELFFPYIEKTYEKERTGRNALRMHKPILDSFLKKDYYAAVKATKNSISEWRKLFSS